MPFLVRPLVAFIACTLVPHAVLAQGYDPRYNPNYVAPPPSVPANASSEQLWQEATPYLDRDDFRSAYPLVARAAAMGHPRAEAEMGIMAQDGDVGPENDVVAAHWFAKAAAQGHRAAEYELGAMYEEGLGGLPVDPARAVSLYRASAAKGYEKAYLVLAVDSELGSGTPHDRANAIAYGRRGGELGVEIAQALSNPSAPAHFADVGALGRYVATVTPSPVTAAWSRAIRAVTPKNGRVMGRIPWMYQPLP